MKTVTLLATRATFVAEVNTDTKTLPKLYVKEPSNLNRFLLRFSTLAGMGAVIQVTHSRDSGRG
jgi:hypothetical protein